MTIHTAHLRFALTCYYQAISMGLDSIARRAEKTRDEKAGHVPEEAGPTLEELRREPEFNLYLKEFTDKEAVKFWGRYSKGESTEADMPKLIAHRKEYLGRKKGFETTFSTIEDYTEGMVKHSDTFRDLSALKGAENIQAVLKKGLREMAIKNPSEFAAVQAQFKQLSDFEETVEKPLDARIKAWCAKHNIAENTILHEALLEPNPVRRQELIREQLQQTMLPGRRFVDNIKGLFGSGTHARAAQLSREDVGAVIAQREQLTKDAGNYAYTLLNKNKELRVALSRMSLGKEPAFPEGAETLMTMEEATGTLKVSHAIDRWAQYLGDNSITDFSNLSAADQDDLRDKFCQTYEDEQFKSQKLGLWQKVKRFLFGERLKKDIRPLLK